MIIEHSPEYNEFISFWFVTSIDGIPTYDVIINYSSCNALLMDINTDNLIVKFDFDNFDDEQKTLQGIKNKVDKIIRNFK